MLGKKVKNDENKDEEENFVEPSWTSTLLHGVMFYRCARMVGESLYGFTPLDITSSCYGDVTGDGVKAWEAFLGENCPHYETNLFGMTTIALLAPYIIGACQAIFMDNTKTSDNKKSQVS